MRDFTKYDIWHDAIDLVIEVYQRASFFPVDERYGLTSQLKRASVSIPSNFAEGCSRSSQKEFMRFLEISLGSTFEVKTHFVIATRLNFINESEFSKISDSIDSIAKRLNGLRNKLKG